MFEHTSRYFSIETATLEDAQGNVIAYKRRRFLPPGESLPLLSEVMISQGDRLDLLAYKFYSDPEQYWRICDANNAMNPEELTDEAGKLIKVPIPTS